MSQQKKQNIKPEVKQMDKQATTQKNKFKSVISNDVFPLTSFNYKLIGIGAAIIILGFILMAVPGNPSGMMKMNVSTFLVMFGFAFEIFAIMKRRKAE